MDKIIKLGGIIVAGTILFGSMPFALYAYNTSVTTNNATYITHTSVTLNGFVSGGNFTPNASTNAWFEYGTDISLGSSNQALVFITGKVAIIALIFLDLLQTRLITSEQSRKIHSQESMETYLRLQLSSLAPAT